MFCGKCGMKLNDNDPRCPRCGWAVPSDAKKPAAKSHYFDNRTRIADDDMTKTADADQTIFIDEIPQEPVRHVRSQWEAPVNFDYEEPQRQSFSQEEYYPAAVPNYNNQPQDIYAQDELIPEAYRTPSPSVPQKKKSGNKALVVTIIIASTVILAAVGLFVFQLIYTNSEDYKTQKAQSEILSGNYQAGLDHISGFRTPGADAVREFVELLKVRDSYAEAYNSGLLQTDKDEVNGAFAKLKEQFESFNSADRLPDKLKEKYKSFSDRFSAMDSVLEKLSASDFYDAQLCVLSFRDRKTGGSFTLDELQSVIDTSSPAIGSIEKNLINNDSFKQLSAESNAQAVKTINDFYGIVSAQNNQDKFDLENYRKTQKDDESLKLSAIDKNYEANVGTGLTSLKEKSDAEENAYKLVSALKYAWTAYAFDVQ